MEEQVLLTADEAISVLHPGGTVHTFVSNGGVILGADWSKEQAEQEIRSAAHLEVGGPACRRLRHGLVVWRTESKPVFLEADEEALARIEALRAARKVDA